jgi:hypothetical protein
VSSPFSAVGAKSDLTARRQLSGEEGEALADEVGAIAWTEISSLTGANGKLAIITNDDDALSSCPLHSTPRSHLRKDRPFDDGANVVLRM